MSKTSAVDVSIHAISPAWDYRVRWWRHQADWEESYLVMDIEILNEGIPTGGYSFIVWDEGGVIESVHVNPFHQRSRHIYCCWSEGKSHHVTALQVFSDLTEW